MGDDPLALDDIFEVLRRKRRRLAVRVLEDHETDLTLADLADEVAVRENQASITEIPAREIQRIYLELYHSHIPKLAENDVIDYQQEEDLVAPAENAGQVFSFLHMVDENCPLSDPSTG